MTDKTKISELRKLTITGEFHKQEKCRWMALFITPNECFPHLQQDDISSTAAANVAHLSRNLIMLWRCRMRIADTDFRLAGVAAFDMDEGVIFPVGSGMILIAGFADAFKPHPSGR